MKLFEEFINEARYPALKSGTKVTVAKDVKYNEDKEFDEIVLTNGYTISAAEESGGGYATFGITRSYKYLLKKGDIISFNFDLGEGDTYFRDSMRITINGREEILIMYNESGGGGEIINYDK
jgi:hypothetical protein